MTPPGSAEVRFCARCGATFLLDAQYCAGCGAARPPAGSLSPEHVQQALPWQDPAPVQPQPQQAPIQPQPQQPQAPVQPQSQHSAPAYHQVAPAQPQQPQFPVYSQSAQQQAPAQYPTSVPHQPRRKPASSGAAGIAVAFLIGGFMFFSVVAILFFAMCGGSSSDDVPHFMVVGSVADDSCSSLLDYCQQVSCTVRNLGPAGGVAAVELSLQAGGQTLYSNTQVVAIPAGQTRTVTHQFTEVSLLGHTGSTSLCAIR